MQNFLKRLLGDPADVATPAMTPAQEEMNTLLETASTALEQGFHETALETYQRGLVLARTVQDPASEEHFLSGMGAVHVALRRFEEARPLLDEALSLARRLNSPPSLARALNNLGSLFAKQNQWGVAQTYHQQALDAARPTGDAEVIALTLENLARDYMQQDNPSYAQHLLKEAVIVTQAGNQVQLAARVIGMLASATLQIGERATAHNLFAQAVRLAQQTGQIDQQLRWLQALARLEMENHNYAAVVEHLQTAENLALRLGNQSPEFFMNSALDLTTAYQMMGNSAQAEEYATRALAQARSTGNDDHEASALTRLGMAAFTMGDLARAESFLTDGLAYYDEQKLVDQDEHVQILLTLGRIALLQKRPADAVGITERALEMAREASASVGDGEENAFQARESEALHLLGNLASAQGERDQAFNHWQAALNLVQDAQPAQAAQLHCDIARARRSAGDFRAALDEYEKAQLLLNRFDHPPTRGLVLSNAATLYTEMGDIDTAQAFYEESIDIARAVGDRHAESLRLGNLGWFFALTGRAQTAIERLETALKISRALEDTLLIAVQTNNLGCTYYLLADYQTARTLHKQAVAAATAIESDQWLAVFQADLARTLVALGRQDEAEALYQPALATAERLGDLETLVRVQARYGALLARTSRIDQGGDMAIQAERRARRMNYTRGIADALVVRGDVAQQRLQEAQSQQLYAEALRLYTILHDPAAERLAQLVPQA